MKKIIASGISSIACVSLAAQSLNSVNHFSSQLKDLIKCANNDFKTIPLNFKLKNSLAAEIRKLENGRFYYHSVFAQKISVKKADSLITRLKEKKNKDLTRRWIRIPPNNRIFGNPKGIFCE